MLAKPPAIGPPGELDVAIDDGTPPGNDPMGPLLELVGDSPCRPGTPGRRLGAPCRDKEKAFILACISDVRPLALDGGGPGRRAAFSGPRGAEEAVMLGDEPSKDVRKDGGLGEVVVCVSISVGVAGLVGSSGCADAISAALAS